MRWYKHWTWQCLIVAPLLPWFYIQYDDWLYEVAVGLGWNHPGSVAAVVLLTFVATAVFVAAYVALHFNDD